MCRQCRHRVRISICPINWKTSCAATACNCNSNSDDRVHTCSTYSHVVHSTKCTMYEISHTVRELKPSAKRRTSSVDIERIGKELANFLSQDTQIAHFYFRPSNIQKRTRKCSSSCHVRLLLQVQEPNCRSTSREHHGGDGADELLFRSLLAALQSWCLCRPCVFSVCGLQN